MFKDLTYKGYSINDVGVVLSSKGKELKFLKKQGYNYVAIAVNGIVKHEPVHRLVAIAFIPNTQNKPFINHINGNKQDNSISNLEWCTHSENMIHAYRILGINGRKGYKKRQNLICSCGKSFYPNKESSKYCSVSCATKNQKRFLKTTLK